jgi:hypothetical protein
VRPGVRAAEAARRAVAAVGRTDPTPLGVRQQRLVVYTPGLVAGRPAASRLAWELEVVDRAALAEERGPRRREWVWVDAQDGRLLDRLPGLHSALAREVYRGSLQQLLWKEGDPLPYRGAGNARDDEAVNRLVATAEETYRLFERLSAGTFLSYNGRSATMRAVYDTGAIPAERCPNASWNGRNTDFCANLAVDDVIAHEWVHGYTEFTHQLVYAWQPGALNEAYSDVFGELVDLANQSGSDQPAPRRSDGTCSALASATAIQVAALAPASVAGTYPAGRAEFGPSLVDRPIEADVVAARDAANDDGPSETDGCNALANAAALAGRIALVDRGTCTFVVKVRNAQAAGAVGVLVVNNQGDELVTMSGDDPNITIPSAFLRQRDGERLRSGLGSGLRVRLGAPPGGEASLRWLIGEDEAGTGRALRDLWHPSCLNDPGRTTEATYVCSAAPPTNDNDYGGVHSNSGVPNHAFALLVDGGRYHGHTVPAIGMTKAAHLYWRAMSLYQTATSDFADHADALEQSCRDLATAATDLPALDRLGPSGQVITIADCAALASALAAVEMRATPPCGYRTVLAPDPPARCSTGTAAGFFRADFEAGAAGWQIGGRTTVPGTEPSSWRLAGSLPERRPGQAFFAPAELPRGTCNAGGNPQVRHLDSPPIRIPAGVTSPRLAFTHYLASGHEDGGNLAWSVNGGEFRPLPSSAFRFNPYNAVLPTGGNANPLAGQAAWSGVDQGSLTSSWGESQVDLATLARPGDEVRLRFAFGTDECGTAEGWYVDDVELFGCDGGATGPCQGDDQTLCLLGGRYRLTVDWSNPANGRSGRGIAVPSSDFTGFFAFDDEANLELLVKLLDFGDVVKVFYGQLTNLPFSLTVTDTQTGAVRVYGNGPENCGAIDQVAFPKLESATASGGQGAQATGSCRPTEDRLCLLGDRFAVEVDWRNQFTDDRGRGQARRLSALSGQFSFTDPRNVELLVKTLDFGDRILFLAGSLTDLEHTVVVTDTTSGASKRYENPAGRFCGVIDDDAF